MPIRFGSEPGSLGGADRLYVGADLVWPDSTIYLNPPVLAGGTNIFDGFTINSPGAPSGDFMLGLFSVYGDTGDTVTLPAGWTGLGTDEATVDGIGIAGRVAWKVAGGSEPSTYTFGHTGSGTLGIGVIYHYSGVDQANPIAGFGVAKTNAATGTRLVPALTAARGNSKLVAHSWGYDSVVTTGPAGMTEQYDLYGNIKGYDQTVAAGAVGGQSILTDNSGDKASLTFAAILNPAS